MGDVVRPGRYRVFNEAGELVQEWLQTDARLGAEFMLFWTPALALLDSTATDSTVCRLYRRNPPDPVEDPESHVTLSGPMRAGWMRYWITEAEWSGVGSARVLYGPSPNFRVDPGDILRVPRWIAEGVEEPTRYVVQYIADEPDRFGRRDLIYFFRTRQ